MKEIIFRGKRTETGEWIESKSLMQREHGSYLFIDFYGFVPVYPETVGQYIGRKDRNGVKIFEDDLVRFNGKVVRIRYIDNYARFAPKEHVGCFVASALNFEVVGNIHLGKTFEGEKK